MSKTKTKRARREAKRDHQKKVAKSLKSASSAHKANSTPATSAKAAKAQPGKQKPKTQPARAQPEVPSNLSSNLSPPKPSPSTAITDPESQGATSQATPNPRKRKREVPFGTYDNILLVGEGDFSFTRSLAIEHGCANVTGTSFDTDEEVRAKYPDTFPAIHKELGALTPPVPLFHGIDATKVSSYKYLRPEEEGGDGDEEDGGRGNGKAKGKASWDTIAFMFPHTGGLSTDVNRQVRVNQALLVSFFESCLEKKGSDREKEDTTSSSHNGGNKRDKNAKNGKKDDNNKKKKDTDKTPFLNPRSGKIIVTLFESSPYTLWNVRDLARHCGLRVIESFEFDWEDYPGYRHVRTLGQLEGGGGWKGEDRSARMYIFGVKGEEEGQKRRKRKRGGESSDSEGEGGD